MSISVTGSTSGITGAQAVSADASPVALRATVSVTYVNGYAGITIEYNSKNRAFTEVLAVADLPAILVSSQRDDEVALADVADIIAGKGLSESVPVSDTFMSAIAFTRFFVDSATIGDGLSIFLDSAYVLNGRALNTLPLN